METNVKDNGIKLVDFSTQYSKFNVNQVLTEQQLNTFLDYFDDQHRFSRTSLSGVGIVCGFRLTYEPKNHWIRIGQGRGITTDGDLVSLLKPSENKEVKDTNLKSFDLENKVYPYVQQFSDNKAQYKRFLDSDNQQIKLYELQETASDTNVKLEAFAEDLTKMVALLYIESYAKNNDLCSQLTCDNQGIEQISRLRVLLVKESDAKYIATTDTIYNQHNWYETYEELPELSAKRVVLNSGNTDTFKNLKRLYFNAIDNDTVGGKKSLIRQLEDGFNQILEKLGETPLKTSDFDALFKFNFRNTPLDFQYRYDALKDLLDTYSEIKELLLDLEVRCSPKVTDFPKHLMLGKLVETKSYPTLRHAFYRSPAAGYGNDTYDRVLSLLDRARGILKSYELGNKGTTIKITPSLAHSKLTQKAIPYYYRVSEALLARWNFEKNQDLKHRFNLSYHTEQLSNAPSVQRPLEYNLDAFDFYRIEGHQGKVYREALEHINNIKKEHGLSFDVKALSVETDLRDIELKDYKCKFEDLKILLDAWRAEQDCVLTEVSNFLSSFSLNQAGKNYFTERKGLDKVEEKETPKVAEEPSKEASNEVKEYQDRLDEIRKKKLSAEELERITSYQKKIQELIQLGNKAAAEKENTLLTEYLKKLEETRFSEEELKVKENYAKALEDLSKAIEHDKAYSAEPYNLSYNDAKNYKMSVTPKLAEEKRKQEALWEKMGYVEKSNVESDADKKADAFWSKLGIANKKAYTDRKKRKQVNVVKESLAVEEDTLGKSFKTILEEHPKASENEIKALLEKRMLDAAKGEAWKENEAIKKFILEDTAQVLVHTYVLDNKIPKEIEDINKEGLNKYTKTIEDLCALVVQLQSRYSTLELKAETKQVLGLLINQLSTVCCSGKKLEILYQEIQKRKDEIIAQTTLSEFVKHHPGLEHKAGVKPGGTFVLVYLKEAEEQRAEYEEVIQQIKFLQQPEVGEKGIGERGILQLWEEKYQIPFVFVNREIVANDVFKYGAVQIGESLEETVFNLSEYLNRMFETYDIQNQVKTGAEETTLYIGIRDQVIQKKTSFIQFENSATTGIEEPLFFEPNEIKRSTITEKNTVIADFSLPYLCCSDCTPVNFIVPKEPVELSLPATHICLKEGEPVEKMAFLVKPANGSVAPMVPDGIESGLTFNEYGKAYFDPLLTDPSLYGQPIGFTVNHELTNCEIIVYPDIPLAVTTSVEYNELNTKATVAFEVSHLYEKLVHTWTDGIGNSFQEVPNADRIFKIAYDLPVNESNTITPSLHVTNGICEKIVSIDPIAFKETIDVELTIEDSICIDPSQTEIIKIPFTDKNPENATITIAKEPIEGLDIQDDVLLINPKKFTDFGRTIRFLLDGMATAAKITIHEQAQIVPAMKQGAYFVKDEKLYVVYTMNASVTSLSDHEIDFLWKVDGNKVGSGDTVKVELLLQKEVNEFTITLDVFDKNGCNSSQSKEITVSIPEVSLSLPNNQLEYCLHDEKSYAITVDPKIEGLKVSGLGVSHDALGNSFFTPYKTELLEPDTVKFFVFNQELLQVTLQAKSKASFEWRIEGEELIVENTSEISEQFVFIIDGQEFVRSNRRAIRRNVNEFQNSVIDISLTAISLCGNDIAVEKGIKIREDHTDHDVDPYCVPMTLGKIQNDRQQLPQNVDLSDELRKRIVDPTIFAYDQILSSPEEILNNGMLSDLSRFVNLTKNTVSALLQFPPTSYESNILSQYYIAQIKLFFNSIHCQPHNALEAEKRLVIKMTKSLQEQLKMLQERNINFDAKNELKDYFREYTMSVTIIEYVRTTIDRDVLPLIA